MKPFNSLLCLGVVCLPAYTRESTDVQLQDTPLQIPQYEKIEFDIDRGHAIRPPI